ASGAATFRCGRASFDRRYPKGAAGGDGRDARVPRLDKRRSTELEIRALSPGVDEPTPHARIHFGTRGDPWVPPQGADRGHAAAAGVPRARYRYAAGVRMAIFPCQQPFLERMMAHIAPEWLTITPH